MESEKYWDERYKEGGNSGYGSYGEQLEKKLKWLSGLDIQTIAEVGCGDFNFGRMLLGKYPRASYTGYDVSPFIVEKNSILYPYASFTNEPLLPKADLVLCVDVLFHILDDKKAEEMLGGLEKIWTKYLAITAYERDQKEGLSPHVAIRKFDPSRFGTPIIREIVEDDGQLYFYLFKRD